MEAWQRTTLLTAVMRRFAGIEIGGTKLQIVVGHQNASPSTGWIIDERFRYAVSHAKGAEGIRRHIETALKTLIHQDIAATGIGFGGPINRRTGKIACSHQIEGWSEFPIVDWIQSLLNVPTFVDNDANIAAYGEALHGAGTGFDPVFYVTLGSGVGGGLVARHQIYHGAVPGESEIGHVRLDKTGRIVEESCSGWAVDKKIRQAICKNKDSRLAQLITQANAKAGEAQFLEAALQAKDALAEQILDETTEDLAFGLSHMVHLLHPEVIVLGGGLSLVGEPLRAAVAQHLDQFVMHAFSPRPVVALAKLGEDAVPIGALSMAHAMNDAVTFT